MDILKISAIGLTAAIFAITVKQHRPEIAVLITTGAAIIILFMVADYVFSAVSVLNKLSEKAGVNSSLLSSVLKIIGVGYISEFSSGICEDAGNKSIGDKISFAGKIIIFIAALPVLTAVIDVISGMIV